MTDILWVLSSITSCVIFTCAQPKSLRNIKVIDAVFLLLFYMVFFALGPISLAMVSWAAFMVWLTSKR